MTFTEYYYLREEMKDISTANKMYHQTNAYSLFKKLERGYLLPNEFKTNLKNLTTSSQVKGNKELSLGRKALYTKIEKQPEEKTLNDFPNFGGVRFEIYTDRLRAHNAVRGVKIKQIAEYPLTYKKDVKKDLLICKPDITDPEIERVIKTYVNIFFAPNHINKSNQIKEGAFKQTYPYLNKLSEGQFILLLQHLKFVHEAQSERESEERLEFTKKNKIDPRNELFSEYNDRLYLNADFMKIMLLPTFFDDFIKNISPHSFIKYYNKMKQWKTLFEKNKEYNRFTQFLRDFSRGKIDDEMILKQVDKKRINDYLKSSGRKSFIPSFEERKEEAKKYNYKTGGKKITKEDILKDWKNRGA